MLTFYAYYCIKKRMKSEAIASIDSAIRTFDEWQNDMEYQFDSLPDWWWYGRIRRLAEYGSFISGRINQLRNRND